MGNIINKFARKYPPEMNLLILENVNNDMFIWLKSQSSNVSSSFEIGLNIKKEILLTIYTSQHLEEIVPYLPPSIRRYRIILTIKPIQYVKLC